MAVHAGPLVCLHAAAAAGGHACAPQRVHAPEAPAAIYQEQAAQGAGRGSHLQRWQVPHLEGGLRIAQADRVSTSAGALTFYWCTGL